MIIDLCIYAFFFLILLLFCIVLFGLMQLAYDSYDKLLFASSLFGIILNFGLMIFVVIIAKDRWDNSVTSPVEEVCMCECACF